ncbi:MAG: HAMP domain-containing sensor histidine kinase [Leptolyngbyaceae cyanobacterium MO_188.B28]|nr:HAMP domain-containing sensor histidine kinase [Leptolyngbyaceae cyanobacterium MO_188.B28]
MFQATRRRLALWYTAVTAVLLLLFAGGFYFYVRSTLVERVDDTLNHVVEIVQRSLVIEPMGDGDRVLTAVGFSGPTFQVNLEASFRDSSEAVEDDHIDLEWFSPNGELLWSTFSETLTLPLHVNPDGETVLVSNDQVLRQITQRIQRGKQVLGYLRVSHPWFEVTKPSRQLILDLSIGTSLMVLTVATIGWLLSGLAIAPINESYEQLKQFTADASHELRNPIAVIQTNVQVALSDPEPDIHIQQGQLQVIERLTRRLGRLVDDLLFLARQESGISPMQREAIALDSLLADVVEEQQAIATDKAVALSYAALIPVLGSEPYSPSTVSHPEKSDDPFSMMGDPNQLVRLFTNLISNALQYTPREGSVAIELQLTKQHGHPYLQVEVKDTGVGIPADALPSVFERFYRAGPARKLQSSETSGSGLGLAIAKVIVENHRGHIQIASQPNEGVTVTVMLPKTGNTTAR